MFDLKSQRVPRARWREVVPPLPKDHAAALGQVAANWSAIDAYCALIIAFWLDIEHVREAVTAELSLMQKIGIITALAYETRDQRLVDHWQDMLTNLDRLRVTRNDAVHGEWRDVGGEHYLATITAKRRVSFKFRPFSTQELLALESEMLGMLDQLAWFGAEIIRLGAKRTLIEGRTKPPLDRGQSHKARVRSQTRAAKRAKKEAAQTRDRAKPRS